MYLRFNYLNLISNYLRIKGTCVLQRIPQITNFIPKKNISRNNSNKHVTKTCKKNTKLSDQGKKTDKRF